MTSEFFKSPMIEGEKLNKKTNKLEKYIKRKNGTSTIHQICNVEIILGFEKEEDAVNATQNTIYVGQTQYIIYPTSFFENKDEDNDIVEMDDEEFSALTGTETFETTKDDEEGVYCGNNRFRDDERMYIRIVRTK
jgi:hypothetical protein